MRRSVAWKVMSAAVAAVPCAVWASDELGPPEFTIAEVPQRVLPPDLAHANGIGKFRLAMPSAPLGGPDADVDGTFLGGVNDPGDGVSWLNGTNWTTNPQFPDGPLARARFSGLSGGASVTLSGSTITLSRLDFNDPQLNAVVNGGINLTGPGIIEADNTFFNPPTVIFSGINILGTATNLLSVGGSVGLTKIGSSPIQLASPNTYMGTTAVNGGVLLVTGGDVVLGNPANPLTMTDSTLDIRTANLVTSRNITVTGTGTIYWAGNGRTFEHSGDISGSGSLRLFGNFGANIDTAATFSTAKSYTGSTTLSGGTLNISDAGAILSTSSISNNGTLSLRQGGSATNVNRIGDSTPLTMNGAVLRLHGNNVAYSEKIGNLNLDGSTSWIMIFPGSGGTTVEFDNINRNNKGSVAFRGLSLGSAADAEVSQVRFANGTASLVGGIIPWAYGNATELPNFPGFPSTPEGAANTLVTYGANGVTPVTTFASDINTSTATDNVLIGDSGATVTGDRFANSLSLTVSDTFEGIMTVGGTGTVHLSTGVILSGHAGFSNFGAGSINSTPGNVVNANINAGTNELIIHTPSAITFNGVLAGSGGMTKAGGRTAFFYNDNTYTGETNLSGFVRFNRNVPNGAPSPFGNSTSAIVLYSGNFVPLNVAQNNAANGTMTGILALESNSGDASFDRPLVVRGTGTSLIRNFSNGVLTMNGPITIDAGSALNFNMFGTGGMGSDQMVVNSVVSGGGRLVTRTATGTAATPGAFVRFNAANTFSGGFDAGGTIMLGHDNALGVGSVIHSNSTVFSSVGGPRNIANPLFIFGQGVSFGVSGSEPFTWSGNINGIVGQTILNITNTATTTFAGNVVGGEFFKQGPGTLVLSGNNSFDGLINVGNGSMAGGMVIVDSNTALGSSVGNSGVNADATGGGNALVIRGGRTIGDELIFVRGTGIGSTAALHATTGANTWGGRVITSAQYTGGGTPGVSVLSPRMTIGADTGASLNITRSIVSLDSGASDGAMTVFLAPSIGVSKLGGGVVSVGSDPFVANVPGGGTSSLRGSVLASGSLDIQGGTLRLSNVVADTHTVSVADVAAVSIAPGANLNIGKNALVVDYTGASPINDIRSLIIQGYAGGAWTAAGITSSDANATEFGIGYADNTGVAPTGLNFTTFYGDPVDNTAVLAVWTRYGDANLDNFVNLADFNRLATNFGLAGGAVWSQGDFNYDGNVNLQDFNRLAANFGLTAGPDGPTPEDWAALGAAVPEPSSLMLAGAAGTSLLLRRRRK